MLMLAIMLLDVAGIKAQLADSIKAYYIKDWERAKA